jgi:hypothetical protein
MKMSYIGFPAPKNTAPVISRRGTDNVFCELSLEHLPNGMIELIATRVEYCEYTGRYTRDVLGRHIVDGEEAVDAACDLEWLAVEDLDRSGNLGTIERRAGSAVNTPGFRPEQEQESPREERHRNLPSHRL